jgi:hypothetical protein
MAKPSRKPGKSVGGPPAKVTPKPQGGQSIMAGILNFLPSVSDTIKSVMGGHMENNEARQGDVEADVDMDREWAHAHRAGGPDGSFVETNTGSWDQSTVKIHVRNRRWRGNPQNPFVNGGSYPQDDLIDGEFS